MLGSGMKSSRRAFAAFTWLLMIATAPSSAITPCVLDYSFGERGKVLGPEGDVGSFVIQPDGKIVAGSGGGTMARFEVDGALDPSFGIGGTTTDGFPDFGAVIEIADDGKLVVAGTHYY